MHIDDKYMFGLRIYPLAVGLVIYGPLAHSMGLGEGVESLSIELCSVLTGISVSKRVDSEDSGDIVDFDTSCQFQALEEKGAKQYEAKVALQNTAPVGCRLLALVCQVNLQMD